MRHLSCGRRTRLPQAGQCPSRPNPRQAQSAAAGGLAHRPLHWLPRAAGWYSQPPPSISTEALCPWEGQRGCQQGGGGHLTCKGSGVGVGPEGCSQAGEDKPDHTVHHRGVQATGTHWCRWVTHPVSSLWAGGRNHHQGLSTPAITRPAGSGRP